MRLVVQISKQKLCHFLMVFVVLQFCVGIQMVTATEQKKFFGVDVELHNVGVDIRVNDVPVYFDYSKGQLTVEVPSPDAVVNGENTLSVDAFLPYKTSDYEEGAFVTATLFEQDASSSSSPKIKISSITLELNNETAIESIEEHARDIRSSKVKNLDSDKRAKASVTAQIDSPFPAWSWLSGKNISNSKDNYESLLKAYAEIHEALKNKDLVKLQKLYSERAKEIAIAYYLDGEKGGLEKLNVGSDLHDENLQLIDLVTQNMSLKVIGNGKLAQISNMLNGQPILYFQNTPRLYHLYKFMFYLNDNNEWVMIR